MKIDTIANPLTSMYSRRTERHAAYYGCALDDAFSANQYVYGMDMGAPLPTEGYGSNSRKEAHDAGGFTTFLLHNNALTPFMSLHAAYLDGVGQPSNYYGCESVKMRVEINLRPEHKTKQVKTVILNRIRDFLMVWGFEVRKPKGKNAPLLDVTRVSGISTEAGDENHVLSGTFSDSMGLEIEVVQPYRDNAGYTHFTYKGDLPHAWRFRRKHNAKYRLVRCWFDGVEVSGETQVVDYTEYAARLLGQVENARFEWERIVSNSYRAGLDAAVVKSMVSGSLYDPKHSGVCASIVAHALLNTYAEHIHDEWVYHGQALSLDPVDRGCLIKFLASEIRRISF